LERKYHENAFWQRLMSDNFSNDYHKEAQYPSEFRKECVPDGGGAGKMGLERNEKLQISRNRSTFYEKYFLNDYCPTQ